MQAVGPRWDSERFLMDPSSPLATAEFLVVDTETNGLSGDKCELTEIGAVLVGGGELHEEASSLVGVAQPLGRYIQRFTGISQEMVDKAPDPEDVLPRLANDLRNRVHVRAGVLRALRPPARERADDRRRARPAQRPPRPHAPADRAEAATRRAP